MSNKYQITIIEALRKKFLSELQDATLVQKKKERQETTRFMSYQMEKWNKDIIDCDFDFFLGELLAAEPIDLRSNFYEALKEEDLSTFDLSEDIWFTVLFNGIVEGRRGYEEGCIWRFQALQETLKEIDRRKEEEEKKRIEEEKEKMFPSTSIVTFTPLEDE